MSEHESGSRLDAAIDRAVRRMMDAEPRPGLRRRVLARLESPASAIAWWPRLGAAAATMAAIALAVVYMNPWPQRPPTEPAGVIAEAPSPIMPPPEMVPGVDPPMAPAAEPPAPARQAEPAPRVERLPDPPRVDDVFGTRPDGRVAAATVDAPALAATVEPDPLPDIEPLQVPALAATEAMEEQDPPPAQSDKPAAAPVSPALTAINVRIELTLTEDGEGAAAPKTVSMLVTNRELGRIRSGVSGVSLNVDARPTILDDGRVRVALTIEYAPGNLSPMSQSVTTVLTSGKPLVVSHSPDPKSTRRVQAELTATIVK